MIKCSAIIKWASEGEGEGEGGEVRNEGMTMATEGNDNREYCVL